jgi:hypothetical protein
MRIEMFSESLAGYKNEEKGDGVVERGNKLRDNCGVCKRSKQGEEEVAK